MACRHGKLASDVSFVHQNDDGSVLVDVWCELCGLSGGVFIEPKDVQWGDEDEESDSTDSEDSDEGDGGRNRNTGRIDNEHQSS